MEIWMNRRSVDALVISLASRHGMVVTRGQMAEAGVAAHLLERRNGGLLTRFSPGVYVLGELTAMVRLRAVLAAVPAGVASHHTGSGIHRLAQPPLAVVEVLTPARSRRRLDGVRIRTTRWLPADDVTVVDGVPVTSVARTLCDLAAVLAPARLRHLVEVSITEGRLSAAELQACAAAYCRRGRPGSGLVQSLNHELFDETPLAASVLERRAHRLLREAAIGGWVAQYRPPWYDGVRGVVDLAWPDLRVVVELDGRRWHATTQAQGDDRRRDRLAIAHGWITLRFNWQEITQRPATVVAEIGAAFNGRRRALLTR
jgi:very-short-patch-repair endonuclease